jgi:hypothetical protein
VNALGLRRLMFAVDDLDTVLARLQSRGAELISEVVQFEDTYRLCSVRGPRGHHDCADRAAQLKRLTRPPLDSAVDRFKPIVALTRTDVWAHGRA